MPGAEFFSRLGVFAARRFFDSELCRQFRSEIGSAARESATVVDGVTLRGRVKENVRKTKQVDVPLRSSVLVRGRMLALKPALETYFGLSLTDCEPPQFRVYHEGDFFRPHRDGDEDLRKPAYVNRRRVSVVVFLNGGREDDDQDSYSGGTLMLYGLIDDPSWSRY